jgi:PPE-repeat protein
VAWDGLAAELHAASSCYRTVIAGLTTQRWMGPSSLAMASAFAPYMAWTAGAAARAAESAGQARLAVEVYEAAFAMTVPPPAVAANRAQLAMLVATNFFGQNAAAIAATEAEYGEMWAQDAAAMYEYAAGSAAACSVTQFNPAPKVTNESGMAEQAATVGRVTAQSEQANLAQVVSKVPTTLHQLSSPMKSSVSLLTDTGSDVGTTVGTVGNTATDAGTSSIMTGLASGIPGAIPSAFSAAATPLYGMSSILGMAQTAQGLANAASSGAMAAAGTAASGVASAASSGAGALGSLGSGVFGSLGSAASLGPLAVPASWTSVIPAANSAVSALPAINLAGANVPPSVMGSLPRLAAASGKSLGPRYGVIPTVMTRPPAAGYA